VEKTKIYRIYYDREYSNFLAIAGSVNRDMVNGMELIYSELSPNDVVKFHDFLRNIDKEFCV